MSALIAGGSAVLGTGANAWSTGRMNRKSMRFSREMYQRQLDDNFRLWQIQNDYNSPQAQMRRFQEAGLNPHLIYGQGNSGNAAQLSSPNPENPQFRPTDFSLLHGGAISVINALYDLELKQAQVDNFRAQNSVLIEDAMLRRAQTTGATLGAERTRFDLDLDTELRDVSADARRETLRQLRTSTDQSINRDAREALASYRDLQTAAESIVSMQSKRNVDREQIEQMRATVDNMRKDGTLKDLETDLRRLGLTYSDPLYQRVAARLLSLLIKY